MIAIQQNGDFFTLFLRIDDVEYPLIQMRQMDLVSLEFA